MELAVTGLAAVPGLRDAAVTLAGARGRRDVPRRVPPRRGHGRGPGRRPERLRATLPGYMVPTHLQWISRWPLTPSGKRDDATLRRAPLTAPGRTPDAGPRDAYERALTEMLADVYPGQGGSARQSLRPRRHLPDRDEAGGQDGTALPGAHPPGGVHRDRPPAGLAARLATAGRAAFDPLVPTPQGTRPPLFMVHPMGGNVLCYVGFARHLPDDQPLYALQAAGASPAPHRCAVSRTSRTATSGHCGPCSRTAPYAIGKLVLGGFVAGDRPPSAGGG
ncbi:non-ribosomal peptide synthetase [Streptomyces hirsutus]